MNAILLYSLYLFGFFCLTRLLKFVELLVPPFYCRWLLPRVDLSKYADKWVVFTGATDGIGEAYCNELARRGLRRFLLIGRNADKLRRQAQHLAEKYGCEVEIAVFDFASDDLSRLPVDKLRNYDIGILANFAGIAVSRVAPMHAHDEDLNVKIIRVNVTVTVKLIEHCLPGMLARNQGIIVNCGSSGGWRPAKNLGTYSASKAAISFFTECMRQEYASTNLRIQCLMPNLVATKLLYLDKHQKSDLFVVNADDYAREAVDIIGVGSHHSGCRWHDIVAAVFLAVPYKLALRMAEPFVRSHQVRIDKILDGEAKNGVKRER